jgi:hypothetical protein
VPGTSDAHARRGFGRELPIAHAPTFPIPAAAVSDHRKFVILSLPRTGSTYLVDCLNAIEGVRCLSEIFHPNEIALRHHRAVDPELMDKGVRDADPLGYLQRIEREVTDCRWFGFKHFPRHGVPLMRHLCASREWRKIFLWRDNLLEQYLSFLLASMHFGRTGWGRVPDDAQLTLPLSTLIDDLHTIEQNYFEIERMLLLADHNDVFSLEYEDLGRPQVVRALLEFLGLPGASIDRAVAQMTAAGAGKELKFARGPRAAQRIRNLDEIRAALRDSRYRRWVAD